MVRQRIAAWISLCCFAAAVVLPGFAAALPADDGRVSIVICSPDGLKTIEIAQSEIDQNDDLSDARTHPRCDLCQIHCGMGEATQFSGWAFPQSWRPAEISRPADLKTAKLVTHDQGLPRGPPELDHPFSQRA